MTSRQEIFISESSSSPRSEKSSSREENQTDGSTDGETQPGDLTPEIATAILRVGAMTEKIILERVKVEAEKAKLEAEKEASITRRAEIELEKMRCEERLKLSEIKKEQMIAIATIERDKNRALIYLRAQQQRLLQGLTISDDLEAGIGNALGNNVDRT